jgi:ElaB/YqjD/DUF883 family membrane-anchored ribosome-binding protein
MNTVAKLNKLVIETEGLLDSLAHEHGPKLDALRERLLDSLEKAKSAIASQGRERTNGESRHEADEEDIDETRIGIRDLAGSLNDYVRRHPWLALATGVLVAASAGILATSATKRSFQHGT